MKKLVQIHQKRIDDIQGGLVSIRLNEENILEDFVKIMKYYVEATKNISLPIKVLLIGEAPTGSDKYIYNPSGSIGKNNEVTDFLKPKDLGCRDKNELIKYLASKGILIFDLYPLPLPSFIYNNYGLSAKDTKYNKELFEEFWEKKFNEFTFHKKLDVVLCFAKLKGRPLWTHFRNWFSEKKSIKLDKSGKSGFKEFISKHSIHFIKARAS